MQPNKKEELASRPRDAELTQVVLQGLENKTLSRGALSQAMGVTQSYLNNLLHGSRPWGGLKPAAMRALAEAIGRPPMWVMVRSGRVDLADFFVAPAQTTVANTYEAWMTHPALAGFVPTRAAWDAMPEELRQSFVLIFEAAANAQRLAN